jgi:hypothetical protein
MPFVANTAITTAVEVGEITQEKQLADIDNVGDGATLATAMNQATNYIMRKLRGMGVNPAHVANTDDFKAIAAYKAVLDIFSGHSGPDGELQRKAELYERRLEDEWKIVVVEMDATRKVRTATRRGRPILINRDRVPRLSSPVDNSRGRRLFEEPFTEITGS